MFALDPIWEESPGRRREVEITAGLSHRRREDIARVDTEVLDQVLPDRLLQAPALGLAGGGGRGHHSDHLGSTWGTWGTFPQEFLYSLSMKNS